MIIHHGSPQQKMFSMEETPSEPTEQQEDAVPAQEDWATGTPDEEDDDEFDDEFDDEEDEE